MTHKIEKLSVEFNWARNRLFDKPCTQALLTLCQADGQVTVKNVQQKPKNKWRPQPMDTIELEKTGSRKLRLSAKTIMTIAEKLYTQGYISYPRTETNQFSKEINLRALVELQTPHPDWGDFAGRVVSFYFFFYSEQRLSWSHRYWRSSWSWFTSKKTRIFSFVNIDWKIIFYHT